MNDLAARLLQSKRDKAVEMTGKNMAILVETKAVSIDSEKKQATFVISTEQIDRHGDIIDQASIIDTYFRLNPYFALQHRSDEFPIGKWLVDTLAREADPNNPGKLRTICTAEFRVEFEDAARAFRHVEEGDMNMVSVGFIPHRVEYDEVRDAFVLYDWELIEVSLVGIGSNRGALVKTWTEEDDARSVPDIATILEKGKTQLEETIKAGDNTKVIAALRARTLLTKAIRHISKP